MGIWIVMYRPSYTVSQNESLAFELIREFPLGLLISHLNGEIETSYLPFFVVKENQDLVLLSHCAKANPHWQALNDKVLISFQGPSGYVSPTIYVNQLNVPTWSYAAVQVHGAVEIILEKKLLKEILNKTIQFFENENQTSWSYDLPIDIQEKLEMAIVGLKIKVTGIEAKFKLSQNRSAEDYNAVLNFFKNSKSHQRNLYDWMLKTRTLKGSH